MTAADLQSWCGLPDHEKRKAAGPMLSGTGWFYYGHRVEHPGEAELLRWAGDSGASKASMPPAPETRAHGDSGAIGEAPRPRTIRAKRQAVTDALARHPELSAREIARLTGTSHRFVSLQRRKRCQPHEATPC
jgi:hypothetical protein